MYACKRSIGRDRAIGIMGLLTQSTQVKYTLAKKSPTPFEKDKKKKKVRSEKVKRKYAISKFEELRKVQSVSTKLLMKLATLS